MMSIEESMDAYANHQSTRNNTPVTPFFFPNPWLSRPDVFFYSDRQSMNMHQRSSSLSEKDWEGTLGAVLAFKMESHANFALKMSTSA